MKAEGSNADVELASSAPGGAVEFGEELALHREAFGRIFLDVICARKRLGEVVRGHEPSAHRGGCLFAEQAMGGEVGKHAVDEGERGRQGARLRVPEPDRMARAREADGLSRRV